MYVLDFPCAMHVAEELIRSANKRWSDASKAAKNAEDDDAYVAALVDAFHSLRAATLLMHPAVPRGCEMVCEYFRFDPKAFFSWDNALLSLDELCERVGEKPGCHVVGELPPRTDFFCKHESQYAQK